MTETIHAHAASPMVRALAEIAYDAGKIILKHYNTEDEIASRSKDDSSPVTLADEEAEKFILGRLKHLAPEIPIIAEEEAAAGRLSKIGNHFFLVDPLDGTKEFINKNGEFTVNIAEILDGKPVRGVVYAPAIDRLFFGEALSGAFEIEAKPGGAPDFGEANRIQVRPTPAGGLTAVASRSHRDAATDEYLAAYKVKDFISAGSSLKFCLVAAGEADIYPRTGRTMEWDTGAGHAVLAAAGGTVTQLDGKPFIYGKADEKFANPFFVAKGSV
ncbi:MAG TPA: 3'(2'),5'-bisphosphate nucleotidase CysQ [Rhizomicrobium sp.]|jgi:3'(2'), 5'-bisphosphate nucleotidase|nr:3'(2'),5'-bisphosphate nucleotidase CysQ [Rhizomicrobium sp.]